MCNTPPTLVSVLELALRRLDHELRQQPFINDRAVRSLSIAVGVLADKARVG